MKKLLSILLCSILLLAFCLPVSAAGSATLSGSTSVTAGKNCEFTVNISGCGNASSVAVSVSFGDGFQLVSGTWLKSGSVNSFDTSTRKGALTGLASPDVNGNILKLVLKAQTASANAQNVSVSVTVRNGATDILSAKSSKSVKINCSKHSYGDYVNKNSSNHTRTCTVCGTVETKVHTWNSGKVTKEATCKEEGSKTYTCTACGATKTQKIAKTTAHQYGKYTTTKEPTCTAKGSKVRTCSVCGKKETKSVDALGHSFSNPKVTKEPTCTEEGEKKGKCTRCGETAVEKIKPLGHTFGKWEDKKEATCTEGGKQKRVCEVCETEEERETEALGHDFEKPVVVKEATIYSTGLTQGKCKRCGETTEQVIPCTYTDESCGMRFEADEGVFKEGTQIAVGSIDEGSDSYKNTRSVLAEVGEEFVVYDISALLDGAQIQPNGKVKVSFTVPEGYGEDVAVFYIGEDGNYEKIDGVVSEDGSEITVELEHFSLYAVCKVGTGNTENRAAEIGTEDVQENQPTNERLSTVMMILILAAVLVLAAIVVLIFIIYTRGRRRYRF